MDSRQSFWRLYTFTSSIKMSAAHPEACGSPGKGAPLLCRLPRQVKRAATRLDFRIADEERGRIERAHAVEARPAQNPAHLGSAPGDLLDVLAMAPPHLPVADEPFHIGP